jgi:hypothetical protein
MPVFRRNRKSNSTLAITLDVKRLVILCVSAGLLCVSAFAQQNNQAAGQKADQKAVQKAEKKDDQGKTPSPEAGKGDKCDIRNNAASLLYDLLGQEKNLSKILILKHPPAPVGQLLKAISKNAGEGYDKLGAMAKSDSSLDLKAMHLPPGEAATRAIDGKEKEHQLLSGSGTKFAFDVLLTQVQALDYGKSLAKVAADNSASAEQSKGFQDITGKLNELLEQSRTQLRALPK